MLSPQVADASLEHIQSELHISSKSRGTATALCLFLGMFGVHRYYVGKIKTGVLWTLTFGLLGFGWIFDCFALLSGRFRDDRDMLLRTDDMPGVEHSRRKQRTAALLCAGFGLLGLHRFYEGKIGTGILWALTGGLFTVGWIRDLIVILSGEETDAKGRQLRSDVLDAEGQSEKSLTVSFVLCAFLGFLGIHRFYMGKVKTGILWVCTLGLCGVGWLTDLCLLLREETVDAVGRPIRHEPLPDDAKEPGSISPKSRRTMLLLTVFCGFTGAHRYYIGKLGSGLLWSCFALAWLALGAFGIGFGAEWLESLMAFGLGWFIDTLMVLCGDATDVHGLPVRNWEPNETREKDPIKEVFRSEHN